MDRSIEYVQVMSNFDSAYNIPQNANIHIHQSTTYSPISSLIATPMFSNRPSSPFFHRCKSPSSRIPFSTGSGPKFNFDLYKTNENNYDFDHDSLSSGRSVSPPSSKGIYHHPIYSPLSSSNSKSQMISKLHQINDELCQTLAQSERADGSPAHYHIHHYPLSQFTTRNYRSRSTSRERSLSTEIEVSPKTHKARVTYNVHIPRRYIQQSRQRMPTSDMYSNDKSVTVDLYPTRDQGFVKQRRKPSDSQNPWFVNGTAIRRNSYSDVNTSQYSETPRESYYDDKPVKLHRRSVRRTEHPSSATHHRSPYHSSHPRPDSAPFYRSDPYQESNTSFSSIPPTRHTSSSKKQSKHVDSHVRSSKSKSKSSPNDTPRSQVSLSRTRRPEWHPPSKTTTEKRTADETESEPISRRKTHSDQTKMPDGNLQRKKSIDNTESKIKSAWEPTVISLSKPTDQESKPKAATTTIVTTVTDENTLDNELTNSLVEQTPKTQSVVDANHNTFQNSSSREQSPKLEKPKTQDTSSSPPSVEKPSTPQQSREPLVEIPNGKDANSSHDKNDTSLPTSNINNKQTHNSNNQEVSDDNSTQEEPSKQSSKVVTPEHTNHSTIPNDEEKLEEVNNDDIDENDQEVANSFDMNKFLGDASAAILGPTKTADVVNPPRSLPKPIVKSPPRRQVQPKSPTSAGSDQDLYNPPFGPKKNNQPPVIPPSSLPPPPPPPQPSRTSNQEGEPDLDDFFG